MTVTLEQRLYDYLADGGHDVTTLEEAEKVGVTQSDRQTITLRHVEETSFEITAVFGRKVDAALASDAIIKALKQFVHDTNYVMAVWVDTESSARKGILGKWTYIISARIRHRVRGDWSSEEI